MAVDAAWWRGKSVFVTGHTGFKGSWLASWLRRLGSRVTGYALAPATRPNLFEAADVGSGLVSIIADVRDRARLCAEMERAAPDIVLHLAAQSLVRHSFAHPIETYAVNVVGACNLLHAVRGCPSVRAAVVVTSDKCYVLADDRRHVEDDALGGADPYSASKAGEELVTASWRAAFFESRLAGSRAGSKAAVATARAGNVIGGGDWTPDRLLPDLIAAFAAGRTALIRNPEAIRPWQHVLDPLRGYLQLARALWDADGAFAQAWNFGPPQSHERSVAWVADAVAASWGDGCAWRRDAADHPKEAAVLRLDSAKAQARLGWHTALPLSEAIAWTTGWHKALARGASARGLVEADLARYESSVPA